MYLTLCSACRRITSQKKGGTMTTIITGANRGIGAALLKRIPSAIGTARNGTGDLLELDVTDPSSHKFMKSALGETPVELLICNAGVYLDKGHSLEDGFGADVWAATFSANVTGVFLTIQNLLPNLRAAPTSKIAIVSSKMGSQQNAPGGAYAYRASKAAAVNLARNLAKDLEPEGIAVGAYHPGWVRTDMGSQNADISVDESAEGLVERFKELDLQSSGCFRTYAGAEIPL